MTITKYVASWLKGAEDDLKSAETLLKASLFHQACFYSHQCAEKCLKGFLAFNEKHVRKVHDLPELIGLCAKVDETFVSLLPDASYLDMYYIKSRYFDDYPVFTGTDAQRAHSAASRVKSFVMPKIQKG
ncbi:MAG: HEPN domain-containing protein [Patescibacteria group bacterium]